MYQVTITVNVSIIETKEEHWSLMIERVNGEEIGR